MSRSDETYYVVEVEGEDSKVYYEHWLANEYTDALSRDTDKNWRMYVHTKHGGSMLIDESAK